MVSTLLNSNSINSLVLAPKFNGLGCPRCSSELVNGETRANGHTVETFCLICDYASTYEKNSFVLAKKY